MIGRAGRWTQTPSATPLQPKKKILIFGLCSTSDNRQGLLLNWNPICHPSPVKKDKMLIFGLHLTSDDQPGRSMDSNPVHHPSPVKKKIKCLFWIIFNFWWLAGLVDELKSRLAPLSGQKNKMLIFGLHSTSDDRPGWLIDSNPVCHPSPVKEIKCSFLDYIQLPMISQAGQWTRNPSATPLQPKNKMHVFGLHSTSDDWLGRSIDSKPICYPSPAKK